MPLYVCLSAFGREHFVSSLFVFFLPRLHRRRGHWGPESPVVIVRLAPASADPVCFYIVNIIRGACPHTVSSVALLIFNRHLHTWFLGNVKNSTAVASPLRPVRFIFGLISYPTLAFFISLLRFDYLFSSLCLIVSSSTLVRSHCVLLKKGLQRCYIC